MKRCVQKQWYAGVDRGRQSHCVCLTDEAGPARDWPTCPNS